MRTKSYISAAALAAALLGAPQLAHGQGLGLNLNLGGSSGVGVDLNVGTGNGLGVDAGVSLGGSSAVSVDSGVGSNSSGSGNSLVDIDLGGSGNTGPNGGSLIDLDAFNDALDNPDIGNLVDIDVGRPIAGSGTANASTGSSLINGDIRLGALADDAERSDALLGLINSPNLADIDLDATINDRAVSIIGVGDLLGSQGLASLQAELDLDATGRSELLDALNGSMVLGSILGNQGIDLDDVLAVQVAENGATQIIVLDGTVDLALLGSNGDIASYPEKETREAHRILKQMGVATTIHQPSYSIVNRWIENDHTIDACGELGIGMIAFSPLAQGVLSGKYNSGGTEGTRGDNPNGTLRASHIEPRVLDAVDKLGAIARSRGQSMVQLALSWALRRPEMTSALVGVRTLEQLKDNLGVLNNLSLSAEEIAAIDAATKDGQMELHPRPSGWLR